MASLSPGGRGLGRDRLVPRRGGNDPIITPTSLLPPAYRQAGVKGEESSLEELDAPQLAAGQFTVN
jgi:hypothetical protein